MMAGIGGNSMSEGSMTAGFDFGSKVAKLNVSTSEESRYEVTMLVEPPIAYALSSEAYEIRD
jgi:hypothetical protein